MSEMTAVNFLEHFMNNNDDMHVIPKTIRLSNHTVRKGFVRVKSGWHIDLGWNSDYRFDDALNVPRGVDFDTYFQEKELRIRWLPEHNNQGLPEQIRNANIYYIVDGFADIPGVVTSPHFHTSICVNEEVTHGSFFPPSSPIMKEYYRLREMQSAENLIASGKEAQKKLSGLRALPPFVPHPTLTTTV